MPGEQKIPSTLRRSPRKAQETYAKTLDSAEQTYGDGRRAHQTAFAAVKHSFEKVGDRWQPKPAKGPSDAQARRGRLDEPTQTASGVNANASKQHLLEVAKQLEVRGRSSMTKPQLVKAIERANDNQTRRARSGRR